MEYCTKITDFSSVSSLLSLTSLTLECSQRNKKLFDTLDFLRPLEKLKYLKLYNFSEVPDLMPLVDLSQLKKLDLDELSKVTNLQPLASLTKLEELIIRNLPLIDLGSILSYCPSLKTISLTLCQQLLNLHSLFDAPFVTDPFVSAPKSIIPTFTTSTTLSSCFTDEAPSMLFDVFKPHIDADSALLATSTDNILADTTTRATANSMALSTDASPSMDADVIQLQNNTNYSCALIGIVIEHCNSLRSVDILGNILSLRRFEIVHCHYLDKVMANSILKNLNENKLLNGFFPPATMEIVKSMASYEIEDNYIL
eukprot:Awhi_evm1s7357